MLDHIGFIVSDFARAKDFYQKVLAPLGYHMIMEVTKEQTGGQYEGAGASDNGPPGLRPHYHPSYYGAFVIDLDGHNIEAVCHTPG